MGFLSTTLPLALYNVILLIAMTILVIRALTTKTQIIFYQSSRPLLYFIKYFSLISIIGRYIAEFYLQYQKNERIADPSLIEEKESDFAHMTALLFGYTSDLFVVRLISLTLVFVISDLQLGILNNGALKEIIIEADMIKTNRTEPITIGAQIKVYTVFFLYMLLPVCLLGEIFVLVAYKASLLGLVAMFATVIILSRHQKTFWVESYQNIGTFTQIFVLITYTLDFFIYVASDRYPGLILEDDADSSYSFLQAALLSNMEYFNSD